MTEHFYPHYKTVPISNSPSGPFEKGLLPGDQMSEPISRSVEDLARDAGPFTCMRLRRAKGQEAVRLAEEALTEFMSAKRRAFVYSVGLAEDRAKKQLLHQAAQDTAVIEREIARTIGEAAASFENLILGHEEHAYRHEVQKMREAEALRDGGQISERRNKQLVASIESATEKVVETVQRTTREILANLEHRFHRALQQE